MSQPDIYAVIMAGGSGTRFWPASRAARPKQFLPISGAAPMIEETRSRLEGLVAPEHVLVVTAASQVAAVRAALPGLPPENLIAEPEARNTGPAVALAAFEIARRDPHAVQVVLPADHVIAPAEAFRASLAAAAEEATAEDVLLTFGVRPTEPATGYGYIEVGEVLHETRGVPVHAVTKFHEKPVRERAEEYLATGRCFWNAGIFVWSTAAILAAVERHLPVVHAGLTAWALGERQLDEVYRSLDRQPVDTAILERAENVRTMPIDYRWNDVGSWAALPELSDPDGDGNWTSATGGAQVVSLDSTSNVVYAEGQRVVALVGVRDLVVVQTKDATLVCPRERAQEVKRIVEALGKQAPEFL